MENRHYTSQYGQDKIIDTICKSNLPYREPGVFIEVGAYNGVTFSNTYFLEKMRDWIGIIIEPIPAISLETSMNRWCDVFQGCIYNKDGLIDFLHINGCSEMLSGISEAYHPQYSQYLDKEIRNHNQKTELISVPCKTLSSLVKEYELSHIDYLSLDTQTSELSILQNYDGITPKCISIDTNGCNETEIKKWFTDHNYNLIFKFPNTNEHIYINYEISWSWEAHVR